jgi:hypothetical protein
MELSNVIDIGMGDDYECGCPVGVVCPVSMGCPETGGCVDVLFMWVSYGLSWVVTVLLSCWCGSVLGGGSVAVLLE